MSRPRVYRTPEEARRIRNGHQRNYERQHRRDRSSPHGGAFVSVSMRPPDDIAADAERRNAVSYSSLTAELCGDPKPGQSALDKRQSK